MRHPCTIIAVAYAIVLVVPSRSNAQVHGFVVTLGTDTVQVERVSRTGNLVEGVIVLRSPTTILIHYSARLTSEGRLATFEQWLLNGDGTPLNPDNGKSIMTVVGDSIQRESGPADKRITVRAAAPPGGAFPLGTIPVGTAFGIWEAAISTLRGKPVNEELTVNRVTTRSQTAHRPVPPLSVRRPKCQRRSIARAQHPIVIPITGGREPHASETDHASAT